WREYLRHDGETEWAATARAHLRHEERRQREAVWSGRMPLVLSSAEITDLVRLYPQAMREKLLEDDFGAWGRATLAGDQAVASAILARCEMFGGELAAQGFDRTAQDVVELARSLAGSPAKTRQLAVGLDTYARGRRLYVESRIEDAAPLFATSLEAFDRAGSPIALWTDLWLAGCEFH